MQRFSTSRHLRLTLSFHAKRRMFCCPGSTQAPAAPTEAAKAQAEQVEATKAPAATVESAEPALEYASSCYIPTTWLELPLVSRKEVSHDATIYRFGLPEGQSLNLPTCACILLKGPGDTVRP